MKRRDFLKAPAVTLLVPAANNSFLADIVDMNASDQVMPQSSGAGSTVQRLHQDSYTYAPGVEYFFLGNGDIHAALQYQPDRSGEAPLTFLGLTLMDAERFSRKWSTFLFHPERGFENSQLYVMVNNKPVAVTPENLVGVRWKLVEKVPVVSIEWRAENIAIEEELFVPSKGCYLIRRIRARNAGESAAAITLRLLLVPNYALFDEIGTDPKTRLASGHGFTEVTLSCLEPRSRALGRYEIATEELQMSPGKEYVARFVYSMREGTPRLTARDFPRLWKDTAEYWKGKQIIATDSEPLDQIYAVSRAGLKALLARSGKRDSGYWQYNLEWVRDDVMIVQALAMCGMQDEARAVLQKNLTKNVSPDGCLAESSRWSGYDYTELDQNGQLVYGAWQYLCWTGDRDLVKKHWPAIVRVGDYPLQDVFLDKRARLLRNKREFWERDDRFGVEDGFELTYQFWVMLGLEKGSELARVMGDTATARRWAQRSAELRKAMFEDPQFRLIEEDRLIKRRTRDGRWQRYMIPVSRQAMPPGSPAATNEKPEWEPDSSSLYPIVYECIDPKGTVARNTLAWMDTLWNQQWTHGGYSRYNTTSEPDPPAPWPISSLLVARAAVEMGDHARAWRAINWVATIHGAKSGGWFERYGPSITPPAPPVSVVGWVWAEAVMLIVHHIMGFRPTLDGIRIRPRLLDGLNRLHTTFNVRGALVDLTIRRSDTPAATVNGSKREMKDGALTLPLPAKGSQTEIVLEVAGR